MYRVPYAERLERSTVPYELSVTPNPAKQASDCSSTETRVVSDVGVASLLSVNAAILNGLTLLYKSHLYAEQAACESSAFAVPIEELRFNGIDNIDLRVLIHVGYLRQTCRSHVAVHYDGNPDSLVFCDQCRLFLTDSGFVSISEFLKRFDPNSQGERAQLVHVPETLVRRVPLWDAGIRTLLYREMVVKLFQQPADNQESILSVFEEEGWPSRIDDPLPPTSGVDPKRRLHDTITRLNRNQVNQLLRFGGDGTGCGVRWHDHWRATNQGCRGRYRP